MSTSSVAPVVILGGGLAGYAAAIEAADCGAEVVLVEKAAKPGGSTVLSGGSFAFAGTDLQERQGIEDTSELLRRDLLQGGGDQCDPELVELYVDRQLAAYEWLRSLGVEFDGVSLSGNQSVPRSHGVDIGRAFERVRASAATYGSVTVLAGESAERLLQDDGVVAGVLTRGSNGLTKRPAAAVVLATGGFSRGDRAIRTFAPHLVKARRMGGEGNTGDGLFLAMAVGAELSDVGGLKGTFGVTADVPGMPKKPTLLNALYRGGIAVNSDARRFVDESISYKLISGVCLEQVGGLGIQIFDQNVMEQTIPGKLVNNYGGALERGYLMVADTIRGVAQAAGLDPDALEATVDRYNVGVTAGDDQEFGRTHLSNGYGERVRIDRAPFYAYPSTAGLTSTYGGIRVNPRMQVAHVLGGSVPGLFAAGEIVGGFHGNSYMSGSSLGKSVVFGRTAGAAAAALAASAPIGRNAGMA
jgi:fumarate reductase flavoprotein subunit